MQRSEIQTFQIRPGADRSRRFDTGIRVLAGPASERLLPAGRSAGRAGAFTLFEEGEWLVGGATTAVTADPAEASRRLYADLLAGSRGWNLARIWNYVPGINLTGPEDLENYRAFSRGRSLAFEQHFGAGFAARVPSASAVGSPGSALTIVFAATRRPVRHLENPLQVPAYQYPVDYGPRAPSFARATIVDAASPALFVSGTAAVRGHQTVAPGDTRRQLDCTLENLYEIDRTATAGASPAAARTFKVYLRHAGDLDLVRSVLAERLLHPGDAVTYLHADICREDLNVEIEYTAGSVPLAGLVT